MRGPQSMSGELRVEQRQHAALDSLHQALAHRLQLQDNKAVITESVQHMQSAFGDLLAMSPSGLISPLGGGDSEREARIWDTFADVYEQELQHLQQNSREAPISKERKRQILADILVWAEITQSHYDTNTTLFVTSAHCGDDSFQRIGRLFKTAKQQRGLA